MSRCLTAVKISSSCGHGDIQLAAEAVGVHTLSVSSGLMKQTEVKKKMKKNRKMYFS